MRTLFLLCFVLVSGVAVALAAVPLTVTLNTVSINAGGNGNRVYLMPNASISGTTLYSMAVYLQGRRELPNSEILSFDRQLNSITQAAPVYDSSAGVLSFTGAGSPSTYAAILRTITYQDNNPNPLAGARTIRVDVSDGTKTASATMTVNVMGGGTSALAINLNNSFPVNATGNGTPTLICPNAAVSGPTLSSMSVYLSGQRDGANELLSSSNWGLNAISRSAGGQPGAILRFSGSGSAADYSAVLHTITYQDKSLNATAGVRTVTVLVTAGTTNSSAQTTINVIGTSIIKPGSTLTLGSPSGPATGNAPVQVCPSAAIFTTSPVLWSMAVYLAPHPDNAQELLRFNTSVNNIKTSYDPTTAVLSVTGPASPASYQSLLRSLTYQDNKPSPTAGQRTITVVMSDGTTSFAASTIANVITTPNTAPSLYLDGANPNYSTTANGGPLWYTYICPKATVSYPGYLTSATIILTNRPDGSAESLSVPTAELATIGLHSTGYTNGVLTIYGQATSQAYQAALDSVTYADTQTNPDPSTRYITVVVTDALKNVSSPVRTVTVTVNAVAQPLASTPATYYVRNGGMDSNLGTSDVQAWETITHVNAKIADGTIKPGDTIRFKRGHTFTGTLTSYGHGGMPDAPLTITDYGDAANPATIQAGGANGVTIWDAGEIVISNLKICGTYDPQTSPYSSAGNGIELINRSATTLYNITIQDVTIQGFGQKPTTTVPPNAGYGGNGHGILIAAHYPLPPSTWTAGYPHPDPTMIYPPGGYRGIRIQGSGMGKTCEISNCTRAAIEITGPGPGIYDSTQPNPLTFSQVRINHVDVHDLKIPTPSFDGGAVANGIIMWSVDDAIVEKCRVHHCGNNVRSNGAGFSDQGLPFASYYSNHVLFQYNEADHNHTTDGDMGFDFDVYTMNSIMQFNYSHDNDGYGYQIGPALTKGARFTDFINKQNIIRFNLSINDCGSGTTSPQGGIGPSLYGALVFEDWPVTDAYVYNNTFYVRNNGRSATGPNGNEIAPTLRFDSTVPPPNAPTPKIGIYNNMLITESNAVPFLTIHGPFPLNGTTFQGNALYSNGVIAVPIINGTLLGRVADPRLAFERNPLNVPTITISDIENMAGMLAPYFQLDPGVAPSAVKIGGVDLGQKITPINTWWAPDDFWRAVLGSQPHDFFGVSVPISGAPFSIGASQSR